MGTKGPKPFEAALKLSFGPWTVGPWTIIWRKSWNVFIKNLNFFLTEERKTWTSWMTWGWVNYQWTTPLSYCFRSVSVKKQNKFVRVFYTFWPMNSKSLYFMVTFQADCNVYSRYLFWSDTFKKNTLLIV